MTTIEMALWACVRIESPIKLHGHRKTIQTRLSSGLIYRNQDKQDYLITNKHNVVNKGTPTKIDDFIQPSLLRIYIHTDWLHYSKVKTIDLMLRGKNDKRRWIQSIQYTSADIVAVKIPQTALDGCAYKFFSRSDLWDSNTLYGKHIDLGMQAVVLGYPYHFYDEMNNFPMARSATVATQPWLDFQRQPRFLIDARIHEGMSGSPVISYPIELNQTQQETNGGKQTKEKNIYLLGIVSDEWSVYKEPLGLNTVWHAGIIKELVGDPLN
jgi:hypothetical protein